MSSSNTETVGRAVAASPICHAVANFSRPAPGLQVVILKPTLAAMIQGPAQDKHQPTEWMLGQRIDVVAFWNRLDV